LVSLFQMDFLQHPDNLSDQVPAQKENSNKIEVKG
jgi:hypothetical protein